MKLCYFCLVFQACTLARRTGETFLKYVNRNVDLFDMKLSRNPEDHVTSKEMLRTKCKCLLSGWQPDCFQKIYGKNCRLKWLRLFMIF